MRCASSQISRSSRPPRRASASATRSALSYVPTSTPGAAAAAASPGSPPAPTSISKAQLAEFLKESFELEVDIDEVLGGPGSTIDVASFEALCLKKD